MQAGPAGSGRESSSGLEQGAYYDLRGHFQRSPLLLGAEYLPALRRALRKAPRLRRLLQRLAG